MDLFDGDPAYERLRHLREDLGYTGWVDGHGNPISKSEVDRMTEGGGMADMGDPVCMHLTASIGDGCGGCGISFTEVQEQWQAWGTPVGYAPPGWQPTA